MKIENINNKEIVGNPRFSYVKDNFTVKDENIILIVGGSLGSEFINNSIDICNKLLEDNIDLCYDDLEFYI